jgi:hypothetical protein
MGLTNYPRFDAALAQIVKPERFLLYLNQGVDSICLPSLPRTSTMQTTDVYYACAYVAKAPARRWTGLATSRNPNLTPITGLTVMKQPSLFVRRNSAACQSRSRVSRRHPVPLHRCWRQTICSPLTRHQSSHVAGASICPSSLNFLALTHSASRSAPDRSVVYVLWMQTSRTKARPR